MPEKEYRGIYNDIARCIERTDEVNLPEYCSIIDPKKGDATCPLRGGLVTITLIEEAGFFSTRKKETSSTKYLCLKKKVMALPNKPDGEKEYASEFR